VYTEWELEQQYVTVRVHFRSQAFSVRAHNTKTVGELTGMVYDAISDKARAKAAEAGDVDAGVTHCPGITYTPPSFMRDGTKGEGEGEGEGEEPSVENTRSPAVVVVPVDCVRLRSFDSIKVLHTF
jgi:hypothetical protein